VYTELGLTFCWTTGIYIYGVIILVRYLLVGYWEIKVVSCVVLGIKNERNELTWFLTWIWKLRVLTGEVERGTCPLCRDKESAIRICLICQEKAKTEIEIYGKEVITNK
jgi:hypothetical protein